MLRLLAITAGVAMAANVELGLPGLRAPRRRAGSTESGRQERVQKDFDKNSGFFSRMRSRVLTDFNNNGQNCKMWTGGVTDWKKKCKLLETYNPSKCVYNYDKKKCVAGPGASSTTPAAGTTTDTGGVNNRG